MKLKDKVAFITGGGQGIGRQIALSFAKEGANVAIGDINIEQAQQTQSDIEAQGRMSLGFKMDVTQLSEVGQAVNKILDKFKRIDILVNNAGIAKDNLILRMSELDWDAVLNVNLKGAFNCIKSVSKVMVKQRTGKIINIASIIGIIGNWGQANYAASKAGIIALTKTSAKEFAARNINVNAIAPGFIQTAMTAKLSQDLQSKMLAEIPLAKFGEPKDIANTCVFLASDDSSYITGQTIIVDGGMVMK